MADRLHRVQSGRSRSHFRFCLRHRRQAWSAIIFAREEDAAEDEAGPKRDGDSAGKSMKSLESLERSQSNYVRIGLSLRTRTRTRIGQTIISLGIYSPCAAAKMDTISFDAFDSQPWQKFAPSLLPGYVDARSVVCRTC